LHSRTRRAKAGRRYSVKFRPPNVILGPGELLIPLVHTSVDQLRFAAEKLDGSSFYVKVLDATPQSIPGGHMVMAKLKLLRPTTETVDDEEPFKAEGKVTGRILGEVEGIQVTAKLNRAKLAGRDRVWFQIRQRDPKLWRVSGTLSYARALDVQFEKD